MKRRTFVRTVLAGATAVAAAPQVVAHDLATTHEQVSIAKGTRIVFQGDSITDGGRWRNSHDPNHVFGQSYPYLLAADLGGHHPQMDWHFFNRGISGNTVKALMARWDTDALALHPGLLSILAGANDVLSQFNPEIPLPTTVDEYGDIYAQLLTRTRAALPQVRLVLCEPFTLPGTRNKGRWQAFKRDMSQRQAIVRSLARKHDALFVPLQAMFDAACRRASAEYWIWDGVHPTYAGHRLLADQWLRVVNGRKE